MMKRVVGKMLLNSYKERISLSLDFYYSQMDREPPLSDTDADTSSERPPRLPAADLRRDVALALARMDGETPPTEGPAKSSY